MDKEREPEITDKEIDRHYKAMFDSVNLINDLVSKKPDYMSEEDRKSSIKNNAEHLKIMAAKTFWTSEHPMTEVNKTIDAATKFLAE
jgi:hypothetical protein